VHNQVNKTNYNYTWAQTALFISRWLGNVISAVLFKVMQLARAFLAANSHTKRNTAVLTHGSNCRWGRQLMSSTNCRPFERHIQCRSYDKMIY